MPVIMGFTSGIAIIIAMGQIDNFFGTVSEGGSNLEKLASYGRLGFHPNMQAVLIGLLVVLVMVFWPKNGVRVCRARSSASSLRRSSRQSRAWISSLSSATFPRRSCSPTACRSAA